MFVAIPNVPQCLALIRQAAVRIASLHSISSTFSTISNNSKIESKGLDTLNIQCVN